MNILVSACLLGVDCKYCGTGIFNQGVYDLKDKYNLIPVCPEQLGGLTTPRNPVELIEDKAMDQQGNDFTDQFEKGANETLKIATLLDCSIAVLKSNSPSCGCGKIYDGTFGGKLIVGNGLTTAKLKENKIHVITEKDLESL